MPTPTHTPGPWMVTRGAQADAYSIEASASTVAHVKHSRSSEANARLIAAAPRMLEALRDVERYCPVAIQDRLRAILRELGE